MLFVIIAGVAVLAGAAALSAPRPANADAISATVETLQRQNAALRRQLGSERAMYRQTRRARVTRGGAQPGTVAHALTIAAATYGVPEARLRRVAVCESTLNPTATNGRYVGLFQFGLPLWRSTPYRDLSRTDPYAAALAAAKTFSEGGARHWPVCGRR